MAMAPTLTIIDARVPYMTFDIMSKPLSSNPSQWPVRGPNLSSTIGSRNRWSTSATGKSPGATAIAATTTSQTMANQPKTPSRLVRACSTSTGAASAASTAATASTASWATGPSDPEVLSTSASGMADPRVHDRVEEVDQEVNDHVADGDQSHEALHRDDLTLTDCLEDQPPHP